jgi:hypothetical protein
MEFSVDEYVDSRYASVIWRGHPARDLRPRVEAQLVQHAADVVFDRSLGYEEARPNLFVAQTVGDQARNLHLSPGERA